MSSSTSLKVRMVRTEIEATVVHRIASDLEVPLYTANLIRRLFLIEHCLGERLYVEVSGSALHTPTGERPGGDCEAPAEVTDDDDPDDDQPSREPPTYLNEGVLLSVAVGLLHPVGRPFKRSKSSTSIYRYVRLTRTGQILAAKYTTMEAAAKAGKPCFASTPFEELIMREYRAGHLSLMCPTPPR